MRGNFVLLWGALIAENLYVANSSGGFATIQLKYRELIINGTPVKVLVEY